MFVDDDDELLLLSFTYKGRYETSSRLYYLIIVSSSSSYRSVVCRQVFSTGLLLLCMMAMSDPRNMMPNKGLYPIANGLLVIGLGLSFRLNCGNAMNPARDLAPRLFSVIAGWGLGPLRCVLCSVKHLYLYFYFPFVRVPTSMSMTL